MYDMLNKLLPSNLSEHEDFSVLVKLFSMIVDDYSKLISEFPSLIDVDNCADILLPKLSYMLNHEVRTDIPVKYQREVLTRLINAYKNRGSYDSIRMAATWGDEPTWVADHIFYPGFREDLYLADIESPINNLFTHSRSKFSGTDKFSDKSYYRDGTLQITLSVLNDDIRRAIKKVVPAGIRIFFIVMPLGTSNIVKDFGEWLMAHDYFSIEMDLAYHDPNHTIAQFSMNSRQRGRSLSGNKNLYHFYDMDSTLTALWLPFSKTIATRKTVLSDQDYFEQIMVLDDNGEVATEPAGEFSDELPYTEINTLVSKGYVDDLNNDNKKTYTDSKLNMTYSIYSDTVRGPYDDKIEYAVPNSKLLVDIEYDTEGIDVIKSVLGIQKRSMNSGQRSGKYTMSGAFTAITDLYASFDAVPLATSPIYAVGKAKNLRVSDVGFNNLGDIEVIVSTNTSR